MSTTVTLPVGASDHGDPKLLCLPTKWTDLAIFFIGNYIAHAATVLQTPGSSHHDSMMAAFVALLFPPSGMLKGLMGIMIGSTFGKTDLEIAARAGALCMVISTEDQGQTDRELNLERKSFFFGTKVHGCIHLPDGYGLAFVPPNAKFEGCGSTHLASNYSTISIFAAAAQLCFAITTLYKTRGDQIHRYGYAAFGLTVVQYAIMSAFNILGNLMRPQYPAVCLVESTAMDEAKLLPNAVFGGTVGRLIEDDALEKDRDRRRRASYRPYYYWASLAFFLPSGLTVMIIYFLSHFEAGSSTLAQRVWIISWLSVGNFIQFVVELWMLRGRSWDKRIPLSNIKRFIVLSCQITLLAVLGIPTIGGFVVVGKMLMEYGVCTVLG